MGKMFASVLYGPNDIRYEKVAIPEIGVNEVLIKVAYAGICGSDLSRTQVEGGARLYPLIIGHEFSGTVAKVGAEVKYTKVRDRVCVAPLVPNPESLYTQEGYYGLSDGYSIIGTGQNGAMAEYVVVPETHIVKIPNGMSLLEAAGVEPAAISFHALRLSNIQVGDVVVILGCGAIGQFAIQCAKVFGASEVVAVDIFDDKLALAKELGATLTINSQKENLYERIEEEFGVGVNIVIETAGSRFTQEQSIHIARKKGTIVFVGISHTELPLSGAATDKILRGELTIKGSWNSYTAPYPGRDWEGTLHFMGKDSIMFEPMISHHISLKDLGFYLNEMYHKKIAFNKVVVDINPE